MSQANGSKMRVIFMGSGDFAYPTLTALIENHNVLATYTSKFEQTNSRKPVLNLVAQKSLDHKITVHERDKITQEDIEQISSYNPDIIIVVSFGCILPKEIMNIGKVYPPINLHPSLLPRWRGAAPIERCIENGDTKTAICVIKITEKLDSGDMLLIKELTLDDHVSSTELRKQTADTGAEMILSVLNNIDNINLISQSDHDITYAKKIKKEELLLDFSEESHRIYNKIRAFDSCGGCYFTINSERIKIWKAEMSTIQHSFDLGYIDRKNGLIYCKNGWIKPTIMQREGKKAIDAKSIWIGLR